MLISLSIKNFLLIESVCIDFAPSFTVITGETGSGKSMLIEAILFCLGSKLENSIRQTAQQCLVIAEVDIRQNLLLKRLLAENSIEYEDSIIIKRQDDVNKRKRFFINDQQVTQRLINQISGFLLEIHGQHSSTILLDQKSHIDILDDYASLNVQKNFLKDSYKNWQENSKKLQEISQQKDKNAKEISYLEFITNELIKANIVQEEESELLNRRSKLQQLFSQQKAIYQALKLIEDSNFTKTAIQISKILSKEASLASCLDSLDQALLNIDEIQIELQNKLSDDNLEQKIIEIEDRLFQIRTLAKKHNVRVEELPLFLQESIGKLESLQQEIYSEQLCLKQESQLLEEYKTQCLVFSQQRHQFASKLEAEINAQLLELISQSALFKVSITSVDVANGTSNGLDQVRFLVKTNLGMQYMPIDQVASGGELSRIMLAIKSVILQYQAKPIVIFDEVDSGVGGAVAEIIGYKLKELSGFSQVISITHQPQIASKADQHLLVLKTNSDDRTFCNVKDLQGQARVQEVARMLSGKQITQKTQDVAKEMISLS
jgi:DNA repair protein RecN (Recombination protein N)